MEVIAAIEAWALGNSSLAGGFQTFLSPYLSTPTVNITTQLSPLLSQNASISLPGSAEFTHATTRWQSFYKEPKIAVAVEVSTEHDVQATVKYADQHNIPFLAMSGGHGSIESLGAVDQGIEIWMSNMNSITIAPDGKTATFGGGVMSQQVTDFLWAVNKQTVTGVCECTSVVGPMLGGGHGVLQGRYGLISDNLLSARVVLGNGTAVTASSNQNPDLFWALQGAGHNFGIVTEFTSKIYDVPPDNKWAYETFIFTHDKTEKVFAQINMQTDDGLNPVPVELLSWAAYIRIPAIDPENAVIVLNILYEGEGTLPDQYSTPFHEIGPAVAQSGVASYPEIPSLTGNGYDGLGCGHDDTILRFPISLNSYSLKAERAVMDEFNSFVSIYPAFNRSIFLLEGYPLHGVKAIKEETTAFPHRSDNLLISPFIIYAPNATLDPVAVEFGKRVRQIFHRESGNEVLHSYVNYAHGDESLQEIYGDEAWRLEKLRALKEKWDPKGRFGFYAPIY